jgi:hypothetical protein
VAEKCRQRCCDYFLLRLPKEKTSASYVFTIASDQQVGRCLGLSGGHAAPGICLLAIPALSHLARGLAAPRFDQASAYQPGHHACRPYPVGLPNHLLLTFRLPVVDRCFTSGQRFTLLPRYGVPSLLYWKTAPAAGQRPEPLFMDALRGIATPGRSY